MGLSTLDAGQNTKTAPPENAFHQKIGSIFRHDGKTDWLVVVLFAAINLLVIINAIWHHPKIGYDVEGYLTYIQVLLHHLPQPADTGEFFSPPLPFFLPSLFDKLCAGIDSHGLQPFNDFYISWTCRTFDGKFAQALNVLLSVGITGLLLLIAEQLRPNDRYFKLSILILLANLTVYYKTFSQVRPEPYVLFFIILSIYLINHLLKASSFNWKYVIFSGISLGCSILSRQWGFFIYPAMGLLVVMIFFRDRSKGLLIARQFIVSGIISLLIGGLFYFHLYKDYGSFSAFNIDKPAYPTFQQAYTLLRNTHLRNFELFTDPVRPAFTGSLLPILYSETWGDYWGYFTYIKPNSSYGANGYSTSDSFIPYLGRVNLISIPTSLLLLAGMILSLREFIHYAHSSTIEKDYLLFICLVMSTLFLGFTWFIYSYVLASSKVLKATYMLQALVVLVFPAAELLERLRTRWPVAYFVFVSFLAYAFIHNIPAMITHYNVFNFWNVSPLNN